MRRLEILYPFHADDRANSHVPISLLRGWRKQGCDVTLIAPSTEHKLLSAGVAPALRGLVKTLAYRVGAATYIRRKTERFYLNRFRRLENELAYLWAGVSLEAFEELKELQIPILLERINCPQQWVKPRLDSAYEQLGLVPEHHITPESIAQENAKLQLADAIFCPSPMVVMGLRELGVEENKLLPVSYGWAPQRFPHAGRRSRELTRNKTFLFVGSVCVRKGAPMLLRAWEQAGEPGSLVLCGAMEEAVARTMKSALSLESVKYIGYSNDVGRLYREADFFVFPTLEEGGPLVTYEAMAHGVIPIVSPMGAGAVAQDGINARVMESDAPEAWAEAFRILGRNTSHDALQAMSDNAVQRADEFTWDNVADRRWAALEGAGL